MGWAILLHYEQSTSEQRRAFEQWRAASIAHAAAWSRIEGVFRNFDAVPADLGKQALSGLANRRSRRNSLQLLGLLAALPLSWGAYRAVPWQTWSADVATAAGERHTLSLPDGSSLVLNSGSAVDIVFDARERRVQLLEGEILVTTNPQARGDPRPFLVQTPQGTARALGTRFGVRRMSPAITRVAVYEAAVQLHPLAAPQRTLTAGQGITFTASSYGQPATVSAADASWERGMLLARNLRLEDVVAELARHRPGVLRCDPSVAGLRVSGSLSLDDTDGSLAMLADAHGLKISRWSRYWVGIGPGA